MTDAEPDRLTLRQVVGLGVRQLREAAGKRQSDVAQRSRQMGYAWTSSKVAALERGDKALPAEEFVLLPLVLTWAGIESSRLSDLITVPDATWIELSPRVSVRASALRELLDRGTWKIALADVAAPGPDAAVEAWAQIDWSNLANADWSSVSEGVRAEFDALVAMGGDEKFTAHDLDVIVTAARQDAEQTAGRRLKVPPLVIAHAARTVWGRSLTDERDRRAEQRQAGGGRSLQAARGHATRELYAELGPVLDRWRTATGTNDGGQ